MNARLAFLVALTLTFAMWLAWDYGQDRACAAAPHQCQEDR